jgi:hypothetical protein
MLAHAEQGEKDYWSEIKGGHGKYKGNNRSNREEGTINLLQLIVDTVFTLVLYLFSPVRYLKYRLCLNWL